MDTDTTLDPAQAFINHQAERYRIVNEVIAHGNSPLQQFYNGAVVLITGASGFLGKQLVEKLFRSCKVKKIIILIRPKKQKDVKERLMTMLNDPVFEYLNKTQPDFSDKIQAVKSDLTTPGLGIEDEEWKMITEEVDIIFHGAASVHFGETLRMATLTNVHGTREMLALGRACKKLKSYVHISTAYSHATMDHVNQNVLEQFYKSPIAPNVLIDLVRSTDEKRLEAITLHLCKNWPTTYAFSKAVAEEAVRTFGKDLPICIVRPAIVVCAFREPIPGWIDKTSAFGPSGFILGTGVGVLHVLNANAEARLDLVPVDYVNNAVIAAAQETVNRREQGLTDIKIYTVTNTRNPLKFGRLVEIIQHEVKKFSTTKAIWNAYGIICSNIIMFYILSILSQNIPGLLADGALLLLGKKPMLTKLYYKVLKFMPLFGQHTINEWLFDDANLRQLYWNMSPADRTIFSCLLDTVNWQIYLPLWCIGVRKYIIEDNLENSAKAEKRQFWFRILHYIVVPLYLYAIYSILFYICLGMWYIGQKVVSIY